MAFKMKGFSPFHQEEKKMTKMRAVRQPSLNDLSFKKAFRAARDAGVKKFTWKGKSYTTETKEEASPMKDLGHGGHPGLSTNEASKRTHGGKMSPSDLEKRQKKYVGAVESMRRKHEREQADINEALDKEYPDRYTPGTSIIEDIRRSAYSDKERETEFPLDPPKAYRDSVENIYRRPR